MGIIQSHMEMNPHVLGRMISSPVISTSRSPPLDVNPESYGGLSAETQANVPPLGTAELCCVQHMGGRCAGLQALGSGASGRGAAPRYM